MSQHHYFITRNYYNRTSAGNKAKTDNEDIMQRMGFENIGLHRSFIDNKVAAFFLDLMGVARLCLFTGRHDIILLQYPLKKYFSFICNVAHLKGSRVVALIHDLGSFRRRKLSVRHEISRLSHADYVIASNEAMEQWLHDNGLKRPTGALGLFDYLSPNMPQQRSYADGIHGPLKVVYAGSLNSRKNSFFLQMPVIVKSYSLVVYGNKDGLGQLEDSPHISFHGFAPADEFIAHVDADFGLIWDGDSVDGCTGNFGAYLQYNSPHKMSFYLRAGLPVIIWSKAALAPLVRQHHIGICIDSLRDLDDILRRITPEEMTTMRTNALAVARRLSEGCHLQEAVTKALQTLEKDA